ncbi:MAG: hypothetical protein E7508_04905 [Ruminococcus sp.]|nr:hypothetical protein [Ruminococcus sp.]
MAKKKTEEEMIVSEEITAETDFNEVTEASQQSEPDTETEPEISETEKTGVFITLKKGGSYHFREFVFKKDAPVPVDEEIADRLMKTGFFERND